VTIQPVSQAIRPLRRRMLEDMAMRGLRAETQRDYVRFVHSFAAFLRRPPDTATPEDIRRFQVHQAESGVQPPTINCSVSALLELAPGPKYRAALGTAYGAG
jgi:integrase/recombinase XerD